MQADAQSTLDRFPLLRLRLYLVKPEISAGHNMTAGKDRHLSNFLGGLMRNLLIAATIAAFAAPIAAAEDGLAGFTNAAGGMTIITVRDQYCGSYQMFDGYAYGKTGKAFRMCWLYAGNQIRAVFEDGSVYIFPASVFETLAKEPEVEFNQP